MANEMATPEAWVAATVGCLQSRGSWTGRIHIHKLLFLLNEWGMASPPIRFELYLYGPYSFDLDRAIGLMEVFGQLDKTYPQPGYGPSYELDRGFDELSEPFEQGDREAIDQIALQIATEDSRMLELMATCVWVENREGVEEDPRIVEIVQQIKPQYQAQEVESALEQVRELRQRLQPA